MKNLPSYEEFMSEYITEGLIKVPKSLLKTLIDESNAQYISYLALKLPKEAEELSKLLKVEIRKNFQPINVAIDIDGSVDDSVSKKIRDSWKLQFGYLKFIIDWEQKIWAHRPKVNASYEETDEKGLAGHITINPRKWMALIDSGEFTVKSALDLIDTLKVSMWHECTHAVQHSSLRWLDPNQIAKSMVIRNNPDSDPVERRREYLSSNVEFDPQIKTKIGQFQRKYNPSKLNKKELATKISQFVGAIPSDIVDEYFLALKLNNIQMWKAAIKKFYLNWDFDIKNLV